MTHALPEEHSSGTSFSRLHVRSKMWGLIHPDEKEDVGRKKKDGDRTGVKGEREVAPPRQLKAMRGTAVGSFLFGYVNPHAPHTHTHIFIQLLSQKARVLLGGVMMEGNYGDTSLTPHSSPNNLDLPALLLCLYYCYHRALRQGCPTVKWLPDPFVWSQGWGHCTGRMHWVCGQWRHGEERVVFLASYPEALLLFFPPPSCGFMAYLPVADFHLATRGDLWQICCRDFDRGSRRKGSSSRAPVLDRMTQGGLQVLGAI